MIPAHLNSLLDRWQEERSNGRDIAARDLCPDRPELVEELERAIEAMRQMKATRIGPDDPPTASLDGQLPPPRPDSATLPDAAVVGTACEGVRIPGYEILAVIGRGAMGVVYKARNLALDRVVALKMILSGPHASADEAARFRTEAQAAARLCHPGIVAVHEIGEHEGRPYLAMEYCAGGSLDDRLNGAALPAREAANLIRKLADAVQAAHDGNVLHRDLKPSNVLLTSEGEPKITDFGLARKLDEASRQTQTGCILGTPSYMAPEQARAEKQLTSAVDVYALGAILYECLTGRPPFSGATSYETLNRVMNDEPVPITSLDPRASAGLDAICLKCLEKRPERRYASAKELAAELGSWLDGGPIRARPHSRLAKVGRWGRRYWRELALGVVVAVAVIGGLLLAQSKGREKESAIVVPPEPEWPPALNQQLLAQAAKLHERLQAHGHKHVGVLKFLVSKDDAWHSDNVGALNLAMARRLETALVLTSDAEAPLGIIRDASETAAKVAGANHLTRTGRQTLLRARYPLAWGKESVTPDVFVTGTVAVSRDLRTLTINLLTFDRTSGELLPAVPPFTARVDAALLGELGESFTLAGELGDEEAIQAAVRVRAGQAVHPLVSQAAPASLDVSYNGKSVKAEVRDGRVYLAAPNENDKVVMSVQRDRSPHRYKVVLKVNGQSTLEKLQLPDRLCLGFVLNPGDDPIRLGGFYFSSKGKPDLFYPFKVVPWSESVKGDVIYGDSLGMVTLSVFRYTSVRDDERPISEETLREAAVFRGELPPGAATWQQLRAAILAQPPRAKANAASRVEVVPVMSATATYTRP